MPANLRTELVVFDVLKPIEQCGIFGTEGFFQCLKFLGQLSDHFAVFFVVGLPDLLTEFHYFAIGFGLGFVAADDCHDPLCVTLAHPRHARALSLCAHGHGGDQQSSYNYNKSGWRILWPAA